MRRIDSGARELKKISGEMCIEAFCRRETQALAQEALRRAGREGKRRCPLQPLLVLWLVIALPLFRKKSIPNVLETLLLGLRGRCPGLERGSVTDGALAHARRRLGVGPLVLLFRSLTQGFRGRQGLGGLKVWLMDGTTLSLPDTPENARAFGRGRGRKGSGAFPCLRLLALLEYTTRQIGKFAVLPYFRSEHKGSQRLVQGLGKGDLVVADRGFYSFPLLLSLRRRSADFLVRIPKNRKIRKKKVLGRGDWLGWIEWRMPVEQVWETPELNLVDCNQVSARVRLRVRVIEYEVAGSAYRLVTSLEDEELYSARELAEWYGRRWEIEKTFKELKTHLSESAPGTAKTILRSKDPHRVIQEAYALMIAYNLVRGVMLEAAERHRIPVEEISFVNTLEILLESIPLLRQAPALHLVKLYETMLKEIARTRNQRTRRPRGYPRAVRKRATHYPTKRPYQTEHRGSPQIHFGSCEVAVA